MAKTRDDILVQRFKQGDEKAFNALVNLYRQKAFAIALTFVNNIEDAQELSQEAFIKVYNSIDKFRQQSGFYTWFYRILINLCLDFKKKKQVKTILFSQFKKNNSGPMNFAEQIKDPKNNDHPLRRLISKEKNKEIEAAIALLPGNQRMVFILRNYEGMSIKEIAACMDCREGTIKSHLHRAVKKLRESLGRPRMNHDQNQKKGRTNGQSNG